MRTIEILNAAGRGGKLSQCIKANYWKVSTANFIHEDGRSATGVIEYEYEITEDLGESDTESRE